MQILPAGDILSILHKRTIAYHGLAATLYRRARQQGQKFITTNYILTELVVLLMSPLRIARPKIIAFIEGMKASPHVDIVHVDLQLDAQAWQLFTERPDKEWSLVDCASFVVMQQRGLLEAFTIDHHFEQADFVNLLKA